MFGFLNVRKPPGPTSHDVVDRVRRLLARSAGEGGRVKVGHAGTLDPFAEGVLVICLGPAVRLAEIVQALPKRYSATIALGATSDTDDPTGTVTHNPCAPPAEPAVRDVLARFVGEIEQVPPAHSAAHVGGVRAYKLARKGKAVDLAPRNVSIYSIDLLRYDWPAAEIDVRCGGGTYIRALARDVGAALGVGGFCSRLVRLAVGPFRLEDAVPPDRIDLSRDMLAPTAALGDVPKVVLGAEAARDLALGRAATLSPAHAPGQVALLNERGELFALGIVDRDGRTLRPGKVFLA
jgi:tRNA pseudouridine55 synthase